jgi:hypothetical protein
MSICERVCVYTLMHTRPMHVGRSKEALTVLARVGGSRLLMSAFRWTRQDEQAYVPKGVVVDNVARRQHRAGARAQARA